MIQRHLNKETIPQYDDSKMVQVTICLDSGKLATEACTHDVRASDDFVRTESVMVYKEDVPKTFCDAHVMMPYCTVGGCVANEWCEKFSSVGAVLFKDQALVRITEEKFHKLVDAKEHNLEAPYVRDDYIYLVDARGNPVAFHGFSGLLNEGLNLPYLSCTVHTQEAWEQFLAENPWIEGGGDQEDPPPEESDPEDAGKEE